MITEELQSPFYWKFILFLYNVKYDFWSTPLKLKNTKMLLFRKFEHSINLGKIIKMTRKSIKMSLPNNQFVQRAPSREINRKFSGRKRYGMISRTSSSDNLSLESIMKQNSFKRSHHFHYFIHFCSTTVKIVCCPFKTVFFNLMSQLLSHRWILLYSLLWTTKYKHFTNCFTAAIPLSHTNQSQ